MKVKVIVIFLLIMTIITPLFSLYLFGVSGYKKYEYIVENSANAYGVDKSLIYAIIKTESGFNENEVSKKGAVGLMQLMPKTANFIAESEGIKETINLFNANTNVMLGTAYVKYLTTKFNTIEEVICAYNCGEGRVSKWLETGEINPKNIPLKETKTYLKRVLFRKKLYAFIKV